MSEPPSNWNEIKGDKVFWDLVMAFKESDEVWSKVEIDGEDDGQTPIMGSGYNIGV